MHTIFFKNFSINASAAFIYKIALLSHQICLYTVISHTIYGQQSSLFAGLYLLIALTNFGFDEALLPFFSIYTASKQQFFQLLHHFYLQVAITISLGSITTALCTHDFGAYLHNSLINCNKNIIFILVALFSIESIKKSIIAMMQLAFLAKSIAYAQISSLIIYISCVWTIYAINGQLDLESIFIPMLATSIIELSFLCYTFAQFYDRLPDVQEIVAPTIPFKVLFLQRCYNYINQIAKVLYSPNSMTLYFAYALGFTQAATIKFFTNIITLLYTCIAKSVGVTSGAIFSSTPMRSINIAFKEITHRYFQLLALLSSIIFVIISYAYCTGKITQVMACQILLFFIISFLENVTATYEQLLMSQRKAWVLTCMHGIGLLLLLMSGYGYTQGLIGWYSVVALLIIIKIISLFFLRSFSLRLS